MYLGNYWLLMDFGGFYNKGNKTEANIKLKNCLRVGQTVGLCVTQSGELHCYIDGIDKGILCTDMPTDVSYWGIADVLGRTKKVQLISPKGNTVPVSTVPHPVSTAPQPLITVPQVQLPVATVVAKKSVHGSREELEEIKKEKNRLESQLQEKMEQLHTEQQEKKELQAKIREMETKNQKQEMKNEKLLAENQQLQVENQDLKVETRDLQGNVARLSIENMRLNEQVKELKQQKVTARDESWKVNYKEVTLTKQELGRGGWGVIWIGEFRGQKVAVKQMHELIVSPEFLQLLNREINTMAQLRHPNLLQFIGAVLDHPSGNPMIITEIMDISLRGAYEKKQLSPVPVSICLSIMRDVAVGLNYLHCLPDPIIHRDVSSANVLLESKGPGKWKTKISDFGSAKLARSAVTKAAGAEVYSAPESFQTVMDFEEKKQTPKMDVYSYGILLCEVMTCQFPERQVFREMLQRVHTQSQPLHSLILSCLNRNPEDRPTIKHIIQQIDAIP